eukprot:2522033-Prymnesium_polylepis.1
MPAVARTRLLRGQEVGGAAAIGQARGARGVRRLQSAEQQRHDVLRAACGRERDTTRPGSSRRAGAGVATPRRRGSNAGGG